MAFLVPTAAAHQAEIGAHGAGGAWTPASLTGLAAWYKADAGVTDDGSGNVTAWNDQSGNGWHLSASGSARPKTGTRSLNSLNVLDFNGSSNYMANNGFTFNVGDWTVLAVYCLDTANQGGVVSSSNSSSSSDYNGNDVCRFMYKQSNGTVGTYYNGLGGTQSGSVAAAEQGVTLRSGSTLSAYVNGSKGTDRSGSTQSLNAIAYLILGADMNSGPAEFFDGYIAEVVIASGDHTADLSSWNTYCARWGL